MCRTMQPMGSAERRALEARVIVRECAGITGGLVFHAAGAGTYFYLPAGWSGPIRDATIAKLMEVLATRVHPEATIAAVWAQIVAQASGVAAGRVVIAA